MKRVCWLTEVRVCWLCNGYADWGKSGLAKIIVCWLCHDSWGFAVKAKGLPVLAKQRLCQLSWGQLVMLNWRDTFSTSRISCRTWRGRSFNWARNWNASEFVSPRSDNSFSTPAWPRSSARTTNSGKVSGSQSYQHSFFLCHGRSAEIIEIRLVECRRLQKCFLIWNYYVCCLWAPLLVLTQSQKNSFLIKLGFFTMKEWFWQYYSKLKMRKPHFLMSF